MARLSYKGGVPNAVEVRRVVIGLGVGKHVMVKASEEREFRGHIRRIQSDSFALEADNSQMPVEIAYSDVLQVGKNLSKGATIAIVAGAIGAAVAIIAAAGGYGSRRRRQLWHQPRNRRTVLMSATSARASTD